MAEEVASSDLYLHKSRNATLYAVVYYKKKSPVKVLTQKRSPYDFIFYNKVCSILMLADVSLMLSQSSWN